MKSKYMDRLIDASQQLFVGRIPIMALSTSIFLFQEPTLFVGYVLILGSLDHIAGLIWNLWHHGLIVTWYIRGIFRLEIL